MSPGHAGASHTNDHTCSMQPPLGSVLCNEHLYMSAVPTATRNAQTRHYPSRRGNFGASLSAPQLTNGYRRIRLLCVRGAETAASRRHRGRATARIELGVDVADVGVDRVDGDVERKRDLGSCEVRRQVAQDAKLAWAEFLRLRQGAAVGARASGPCSPSTMSARRVDSPSETAGSSPSRHSQPRCRSRPNPEPR